MFTGEININAIYDQFSKIIAPKIAEGFIMTKDWFMDLVSRYIEYSIWYEGIWIIMLIFMMVVASILISKFTKHANSKIEESNRWDREDWIGGKYVTLVVYCGVMFVLFIITVNSVFDLVKRNFVPEIQLYKEIVNIKSDGPDPISK